jgi:hypothetical protein
MAATLPPALTLMADSSAPLEVLNLRVPGPVLEKLEKQAGILNASRSVIARYALALGSREIERQLTDLEP